MKLLIVAAAALSIILPGAATPKSDGADSAAPMQLTVAVQGVRNNRGVVGVLVFRSSQGWPEHKEQAFRSEAVPAVAGETELTIPDLPAGDYSVVVLHDENRNQKLDRNWLGVPREQWGMSNNPHAGLSAPSFEQARFHMQGAQTIQVRMQ